MPTYNYRCGKCGILEIAQPITEPALETCPQCQGSVKRVIGKNVLVLFKGSGFYSTDSKHSQGSTIRTTDPGTDTDSSTEVEVKAATQPAENKETPAESKEKPAESTAKSTGTASEAAN